MNYASTTTYPDSDRRLDTQPSPDPSQNGYSSPQVTPRTKSSDRTEPDRGTARPQAANSQSVPQTATPWVLTVGERTRYYQLPELYRWEVLSETPKQVRVSDGSGGMRRNIWQHKCYCIPSDREWEEVQRLRRQFQRAINDFVEFLQELGAYQQRLKEAGGLKKAPNPLTPTVIACHDPANDDRDVMLNWEWGVYPYSVDRMQIIEHTPKMFRYYVKSTDGKALEGMRLQENHFVCPCDHDWEKLQTLRQAAVEKSEELKAYLNKLGTYSEVKRDGRHFNKRANSDPQLSEAKTSHHQRTATVDELLDAEGGVSPAIGSGESEQNRGGLPDDFSVGTRVRARMQLYGEHRIVEGIISAIESNGTHGRVCLMPDVCPHQVGLQWECKLPPIDELHPFYHPEYPADGIARGVSQIFRANIVEVLESVLGVSNDSANSEPVDKQTSIQGEAEEVALPPLPTDEDLEAVIVPGDSKQTITQLLDSFGLVDTSYLVWLRGEEIDYRDWKINLDVPNGGVLAIDLCTPDGQWRGMPTEEFFDYRDFDGVINWSKRFIDRCIEAADKASGQLSLLDTAVLPEPEPIKAVATELKVGDRVQILSNPNCERIYIYGFATVYSIHRNGRIMLDMRTPEEIEDDPENRNVLISDEESCLAAVEEEDEWAFISLRNAPVDSFEFKAELAHAKPEIVQRSLELAEQHPKGNAQRIEQFKKILSRFEQAATISIGSRVRINGHPSKALWGQEGTVVEIEALKGATEYRLDLECGDSEWVSSGWIELVVGDPQELEPEAAIMPCEYGDYVRGKSAKGDSWLEGEATAIGRKYIELDNQRGKFILIETLEILRPAIPEPPEGDEVDEVEIQEEVFEITQVSLDSFAGLNSCEALTRNKIKGVISWDGREWVAVGSHSKGQKFLEVSIVEVVERSQWNGPTYEYEELPGGYKGQLVKHKKRELVLTGERARFIAKSRRRKQAIPPEPKQKATKPIVDNVKRSHNCPVCNANLLRPYWVCGYCGWDGTPQSPVPKSTPPEPTNEPDLEQRRSELLAQIREIRIQGEVAPKGCWMEQYRASKKLASGVTKDFKYWRMKAYEPLFQGEGGKMKRSLHLGTDADANYKDWCMRLSRRRRINALESELDKIERQLQKEKDRDQ